MSGIGADDPGPHAKPVGRVGRHGESVVDHPRRCLRILLRIQEHACRRQRTLEAGEGLIGGGRIGLVQWLADPDVQGALGQASEHGKGTVKVTGYRNEHKRTWTLGARLQIAVISEGDAATPESIWDWMRRHCARGSVPDLNDRSRLRGFWASCWYFRDKIVWSWDFGLFLTATLAAAVLPSDKEVSDLLAPLTDAAMVLAAALVGVVVAGLAVVVALLDDELLSLMEGDERSGRVAGHLFPYWFVTATGIATFLLALAIQLFGVVLAPVGVRIGFALVVGLAVWTALGVLNLVGSLNLLAINRALLARIRLGRDEADHRR